MLNLLASILADTGMASNGTFVEYTSEGIWQHFYEMCHEIPEYVRGVN